MRHMLILYLLSKSEQLAYPKLIQMLYLIDRELCRRYGSSMFTWRLYKYGPHSRDALLALDDLEEWGHVEKLVTDRYIIYRPAKSAEISKELKDVVDGVVEEWAGKGVDELVKYVNELEEVKSPKDLRLLC